MSNGLDTLTLKERETLRLILRGHDAKSMARELGLSVHTINERLRSARRKLEVTSSKEAARKLYENEGGAYENLAYEELGEALATENPDGTSARHYRRYVIGGILVMLSFALAAALALPTQTDNDRPIGDPATAFKTVKIEEFETTARDWLAIVDTFDWDGSFATAGRSFRDPNTVDMWRDASQKVRVQLGGMIDRKPQTVNLIQSDSDQGTADDQVVIRFVTQFENRRDVIETVTLEKEYGDWKVVGYIID